MTWPVSFQNAAQSSSRAPRYLVQTMPADGTDDVARTYSSAPWFGHVEAVLADQCSISWGEIQFPSMQYSGSSASIALQADRVDMRNVRIGTIVRIVVVLGGDVEPVWVGTLRSASTDTSGGIMRWELGGIESSLGGRYVGGASTTRQIFGELDRAAEGVVSIAYTAGDTTLNHTQMTLYSGGSGRVCVKVTPDNGTQFYAVGLSDTGTQMIGVESIGGLDTVTSNAAVSSVVVACMYETGNPIEIFRRAVDPTVTDWPEQWRMNLPSDVVDSADLFQAESDFYGLAVPFAYNGSVQIVTEAPVSSFIDWISPILAPFGIVAIQRHGKLTARTIYAPSVLSGPTITDDQIEYATVSHWTPWPSAEQVAVSDRSQQQGWPVVPSDVVDGAFGVGDTAWSALAYAHRLVGKDPPPPPIRSDAKTSYSISQALPQVLIDPGHGYNCIHEHAIRLPVFGDESDRDEWTGDVMTRLTPWLTERPEVVTVTLPGWRPEVVGEGIALDLRKLTSRAPETDSLRGAVGLIVGGGPDWFGTSTTYKVLVIPDNAPT